MGANVKQRIKAFLAGGLLALALFGVVVAGPFGDGQNPLRQRMIEDMAARKLNPHTPRSHIYSCKRFAAWLKRSPDTATPDEARRFQLYLIESGASSVASQAIRADAG